MYIKVHADLAYLLYKNALFILRSNYYFYEYYIYHYYFTYRTKHKFIILESNINISCAQYTKVHVDLAYLLYKDVFFILRSNYYFYKYFIYYYYFTYRTKHKFIILDSNINISCAQYTKVHVDLAYLLYKDALFKFRSNYCLHKYYIYHYYFTYRTKHKFIILD